MKKRELSILDKAEDLYKMKKKRPWAFKSLSPRPRGLPKMNEEAKSRLREILRSNGGTPEPWVDPDGQFRLLTRAAMGMSFKEFRYEGPTPEEERRGLLKTGMLAGGLLGAGGLAGLGLYRAGISGFAKKAERLSRAVRNVSANKAAGVRKAKAAMAESAALAKTRQAVYTVAGDIFYGKGQEKHAIAALKAQAAKSRAAKAAAKAQAQAAKSSAVKASAGPTQTTVPEDVFEKTALPPAVNPAPAAAPVPAPPKKYESWAKAKGAFKRGEITEEQFKTMKFSARLRGLREFNFQTDEGGIPFTGKVAKDRFIKKLRDEDLDRRDANILRAGAAGSLAGLLLKGKLSAGKRALIGAGLGGAGVIATRMATNNTRDIYGERSRGAKRAELAPVVAGLGAAGYFASRRLRGLSVKFPLSVASMVKFFEKKKEKSGGLNPYVGAALSGFGSGAALGSLALLRRGATFRGAAKTAGKLGLASAGIVGGGALLGSKIVGDPREEESAPFMKRAAIGGSLVGAGAGLAGALLLRKTKGGAKALVAASKKTEPFSRPAMWLRKSPVAGAAALGAVGGAVYGGGMGADEGQQVDSIRNLKKDLKKNLSAKLRLKLFGRADQPRDPVTKRYDDPLFGWATGKKLIRVNPDGSQSEWTPDSPQLLNSAMAHAARARVPIQRGTRLTKDVSDVLQGKERERDASGRVKKREWEKSWFQNQMTNIGLGAATLGGAVLWRRGMKNPNTRLGHLVGNIRKGASRTKEDLSSVASNVMKSAGGWTDRQLSAKLRKLREFDAVAQYAGWDVRDPRGRSARVFAPGSRRRERRQKEWHEKTENERKLWKAGLVASALGGAGALLVGQRLVSGKSLIPSRFVPKQPNPDVFVDATKMFRPGAA